MKKHLSLFLLTPILISSCSIDWSGEKDAKIAKLEKQVTENTKVKEDDLFMKRQNCVKMKEDVLKNNSYFYTTIIRTTDENEIKRSSIEKEIKDLQDQQYQIASQVKLSNTLWQKMDEIAWQINFKQLQLIELSKDGYNKIYEENQRINNAIELLKSKTEVFYSKNRNSCVWLIWRVRNDQTIETVLIDLLTWEDIATAIDCADNNQNCISLRKTFETQYSELKK